MATVSQNVSQDYIQMYSGYDHQQVGIGIQTANYATPQYAKLRTDKLILGGMSDIIYTGFEHDHRPRIITMHPEPRYNTILSMNLNYVPIEVRKRIVKTILDANAARIQSNQPLIVDYRDMSRAIPEVSAITRRYKYVGIRVLDVVPLRDWDKAIKERSRFESHYRQFM